MADPEETKKSMDPKTLVKYLKAGVKEERRKNAKLQEEIAEITTKLKRAEEELKERTGSPDNKPPASSSKDKETIVALQNDLTQTKGELEEFKKKSATLEASVEQLKDEQTQMMTQYTGRIQELCERVAEMGEHDKAKERAIAEYKKTLEELQAKAKKGGSGSSSNSAELTKLREELELSKKECEQLSEKLEQTQTDQELMNEHNKKMKEELNERILKLEEELKNKEEGIRKKESEMTGLKSAVAEHKAIANSLTEENKYLFMASKKAMLTM